jgi:DNA adenine methylase
MRPVLKWVGGKTQLLEQLLSEFPEHIDDYYEPFVGGASVLLSVIPRVKGIARASDLNPHLIALYKQIQSNPEGLIKQLRHLEKDTTEDTYYKRRAEFNQFPSPALFVYLNKVGFRGMYREGPYGFNVPYGHYQNPTVCDAENIRKFSKLVESVEFSCQGYDDALRGCGPSDFVYMDPPYVPETVTSFTGYTAESFDHKKFFIFLKGSPARWVMSNSATALVREEFEEYDKTEVSARRAINSKNPAARTTELIISKKNI